MTHAIESLASVSDEMTARVEAVAAGSLSGLAQGLQQVVGRFKLSEDGSRQPAGLAAATSSRALAGQARPTHRAGQRTADLGRNN